MRRLWLAGLVAYLALIALVSLLPPPELPLDPGRFDKLWHAGAYAFAAFCWVPLVSSRRGLLWALLGLAAYGLCLEGLQGLSGYRSLDLIDALANTAGAAVGTLSGLSPWRGVMTRPPG